MTFCTDIDLLHWEPNLLRDAAFASQTLIGGTGDARRHELHDRQRLVRRLEGEGRPGDRARRAARRDVPDRRRRQRDAADAERDVRRAVPDPQRAEPVPGPIGTAGSIAYAVRTFWPQRLIVSELLLQAAGLEPRPSRDAVLNPDGAEAPVHAGHAADDLHRPRRRRCGPDGLLGARRPVRAPVPPRAAQRDVEVDLDGDGIPESRRALNVLELRRG